MERRGLEPEFARHLQDLFFFHQLVEQMHQQHGDAYHAKYMSVPLGVWGGRMGVMFRDDLHDLVEAIHLRQQKQHRRQSFASFDDDYDDDDDVADDDEADEFYDPWTDRRLKATLEKIDDELETHRAFMNLYFAYAQKL